MENKYKNIERLLELFFNGKTSNAEEKELYNFFAGEDIPEELEQYKKVFNYFETEIHKEDPSGAKEEAVELVAKRSKVRLTWGISIAASLLLFLSFGLLSKSFNDKLPYEGYIIRNGKFIANSKAIQSELEEAYLSVIACIEESEMYYYDEADFDYSPYDEFLNEISDEKFRNRVYELIQTE